MFESLSDKILSGLKKISGQGKISQSQIEEALKTIRLALLEADVNFKVVKQFVDAVSVKAMGQEIVASVTAGQQIIKIVHDELVHLLGDTNSALNFLGHGPHVIMLVGLQGAGKTTSSAKLARHISKKGRQPLLVPVDVQRPAAIEQLKTLGRSLNLPVFDTQGSDRPSTICKKALVFAQENGKDTLIVDTAGRLQIDEELMSELVDIKKILSPAEILFVADSMSGQEAVNVALGFHEKLCLTGVVLTKMDGDARGGAALSIKATTGIPVKFVGISEKLDGLEPFHPDRIAGRILDMGDVVGLVEKASEVFEESKAKDLAKKIRKNQFTLEDFRDQMRQLRKMGPLEGILKMLPGMGQVSKQIKNMAPPEKELTKIEAIINSMTVQERENYHVLNGSRRARIAKGSGTHVSDINRFIKQFEQTRKMMQMMTRPGSGGMGGLPSGFSGRPPFRR